MSNSRFYQIVIVLLLLLNGSTLAYLWLNDKKEDNTAQMPTPPIGRNRVDVMLREKLQLTPEQEKALQHLKEEHHGQMVAIQKEERELHKGLYLLLTSAEADETERDVFFARLAENDHQKEKVTFEHFAKMRLLLSPEQLPLFDEFVEELASKILSHHRMGKEGRRPPRREMH